MAFDPTRLFSLLQNTGLAIKDNSLYQVINQIIAALGKLNSGVNNVTNVVQTGGAGASPSLSYITINNESVGLPNSRQIVAGTNITLDITTPGQITINSSGGGSGIDHVIMSDGVTPLPIDDGFGNFVYVAYTP